MDKYEHRRLRLIELKDAACDGKIARLAERIARSDSYVARMLYVEGKDGKKRIGDDMLEVIETAFGLPRGWFDRPLGTPMQPSPSGRADVAGEASDVGSASNVHAVRRAAIHWPFPSVTYQRLMDLKRALGPKAGSEAIHDIDSLLDIAVTKWERLSKPQKRQPR